MQCLDENGRVLWEDTAKNIVTDQGVGLALDYMFGLVPVAAFKVGLAGNPMAVDHADTMAAHPGWAEVVAYAAAVRPGYSPARAALTVSNQALMAAFAINGPTTVSGAFLTTSDVKGGAAGSLLCVAPFVTGNKDLVAGQTLRVRYDFTGTDDGV